MKLFYFILIFSWILCGCGEDQNIGDNEHDSYSEEKQWNKGSLKNDNSFDDLEENNRNLPSVSIEGPSIAYLNKAVNYNIAIKNTGKKRLRDVTATVILPKNIDYVSSIPAGILIPGNVEKLTEIKWQLWDIPLETV